MWLALFSLSFFGSSFLPSSLSSPPTCSCSYRTDSPPPSVLLDCTDLGLRRFPLNATVLESEMCRFEGANVEVDLSRNKITHVTLPPSLKGLTRIDLSRNEITHVKNVVIMGAELKELDLSLNEKLEKVTRDLKSESLEILKASRCSINELEEGFLESVPSLKSLDVSHNDLKELNRFLPPETRDVERSDRDYARRYPLTFLNVSHNSIRRVEGKDLRLTKIKILDLSGNDVTHLKFTVYFRYLEELYASGNDLKTFDGMVSPNLLVLDLSKNKFREIGVDFAEKAPKLKILNLSYNALEEIPKIKSFSISDLDLSHCRIRRIRSEAFSTLERLQRLNLKGNELAVLHQQVLVNSRNLEFLHLGNNPWKCDCESPEFKSLYKFVLFDRGFSDGGNLPCDGDRIVTWSEACKKNWGDDDDDEDDELALSKKSAFLTLIYIFIALSIIIISLVCYKFIRNSRQSDAILFENGPDVLSEREYEEITTRRPARAEGTGEIREQSVPPSYETRRSTPPPNYEAAMMLPALTESQREMAISNLSLHTATA